MFRVYTDRYSFQKSNATPYARYFEMAQGRFIPKTNREAKPQPDDDEIQGQE